MDLVLYIRRLRSFKHGLSYGIIKNMNIQIPDDFFHFQNWKGMSSPTAENMRIPSIIYLKIISFKHGLSYGIIKNMNIQIPDDFFHFQNWKRMSFPTVENMRITSIIYSKIISFKENYIFEVLNMDYLMELSRT